MKSETPINQQRRRNSCRSRRTAFRPAIGNAGRRQGVAAVEAAFCLPLIILIMMGTLEICAGIYLKESISICAFEGARVGVRRRATSEQVMARVVESLADRNVMMPVDGQGNPTGIEVIPSDFSELSALDPITVRITVPTEGNSIFIFDYLLNRNVVSTVTMVREFDE